MGLEEHRLSSLQPACIEVMMGGVNECSVTAMTETLKPMKPLLSIVVPVYCEEEVLGEFYSRHDGGHVRSGGRIRVYEMIFVNDGSRDRSAEILETLAAADSKCTSSISREISAINSPLPPVLTMRQETRSSSSIRIFRIRPK